MGCSRVNPPGFGVMPDDKEAYVIARGGNICAGYCYPFADIQSSQITADGVTISTTPGDPGHPYACVVGGNGLSAGDIRAGRMCIAINDIPDLGFGAVKVKGFVRAFVANTANTNVAIGDPLYGVLKTGATPASFLDAKISNTGNAPKKYVAVALQTLGGTPSGGTTMLVMFDGWDGIGGGGNT